MGTIKTSSGVEVGYLEQGDGVPVVLLPATGSDHTIFMAGQQIQALSAEFRVIAVDHRGTGQSMQAGDDYAASDLAHDAVAILDDLEIGAAHVVGLSFGSGIAQHVAIQHPDRVKSLVLYNTWAQTDEYLRRLIAGWELVFKTADPIDYGRFAFAQLLSRRFINGQPEAVDAIAGQMFASDTASPRETHLRHLTINAAHDASESLGELDVPALLVTGSDDRVIPPSYTEEAADLIAGADLKVLTGDGATHGLVIERAEEVNRLTLEFLKGQD